MPDALSYGRLFASKVINNAAEDDIFTMGSGSVPSGVLRNLVIFVQNSTAGTVTLDGWVIPASGTSATANKFLEDYSIAAKTGVEIAVPKMITGDKLTLQASAAASLTVFDHDSVIRT